MPSNVTLPGVDKHSVLENLSIDVLLSTGDKDLNDIRTKRAKLNKIIAVQCLYYASAIEALLKKTRATREFQVGIIGAGQIGCAIVEALLLAGYNPKQISLATRQPELLQNFANRGIILYQSSKKLIQQVAPRVLFLTCQLAQVPSVSKELLGHCKPSMILCSTIAGLPYLKLRQLFRIPGIVRTFTPRKAINNSQTQSTNPLKLALFNLLGRFNETETGGVAENIQHLLIGLHGQAIALGLDISQSSEASFTAIIDDQSEFYAKQYDSIISNKDTELSDEAVAEEEKRIVKLIQKEWCSEAEEAFEKKFKRYIPDTLYK